MVTIRRGVSGAALVLALSACPKADGEPASASGDGGDATDTGDTVDPPSDTHDMDTPPTDTGDTDGPPPFEPEQTHVVLLDDCGLELACDPINVHLDSSPASAVECARSLHADGQTGLLTAFMIPGGGDYEPDFQHALFVMADRRVIRQTRGRYCPEPPCDAPPWNAWRAHEVCDVQGWFDVEALSNCETVADFSCDEILELAAQPPVPTVPCPERQTSEECDQVLSSEAYCEWSDLGAVYEADSCTGVEGPGVCRQYTYDEQCDLPALCPGVNAESVLFHVNDDGTVEVRPVFGCWIEEGFERCEWGPQEADGTPGPLLYGPDACNCVCG